MKEDQLVEIARSFAYKLNVGNYESRDFFCSQKAEVPLREAEEASNLLYHFCKTEVMKSVTAYIKEKEASETIDVDEAYGKVTMEDLIKARKKMFGPKAQMKVDQEENDQKEAMTHEQYKSKREE